MPKDPSDKLLEEIELEEALKELEPKDQKPSSPSNSVAVKHDKEASKPTSDPLENLANELEAQRKELEEEDGLEELEVKPAPKKGKK